MTHLLRRLKKLEARSSDPSGRRLYSAEWYRYWTQRIRRVLFEGDAGAGPITIEAFRAILIARASEEALDAPEHSTESDSPVD